MELILIIVSADGDTANKFMLFPPQSLSWSSLLNTNVLDPSLSAANAYWCILLSSILNRNPSSPKLLSSGTIGDFSFLRGITTETGTPTAVPSFVRDGICLLQHYGIDFSICFFWRWLLSYGSAFVCVCVWCQANLQPKFLHLIQFSKAKLRYLLPPFFRLSVNWKYALKHYIAFFIMEKSHFFSIR